MFEEKIAAGIAYLDKKDRGWIEKIDIDKLDMSMSCDCIEGQRLGTFHLSPSSSNKDKATGEYLMFKFGFNLPMSEPSLEDPEWNKENRKRRQNLIILTNEWKAILRYEKAKRQLGRKSEGVESPR